MAIDMPVRTTKPWIAPQATFRDREPPVGPLEAPSFVRWFRKDLPEGGSLFRKILPVSARTIRRKLLTDDQVSLVARSAIAARIPVHESRIRTNRPMLQQRFPGRIALPEQSRDDTWGHVLTRRIRNE